jgi:prevent-host-death family protein
MLDVTLADAKEQLEDLIARAERGEPIQIMRDGKPVVRFVGIEAVAEAQSRVRTPIDFSAIRALRDSLPMQEESAEVVIRKMRDDARY